MWMSTKAQESVSGIPSLTLMTLQSPVFTTSALGGKRVKLHSGGIVLQKALDAHSRSEGCSGWQELIEYVEYLTANHYVPPDAKGWVDHIRTKGNEANHEIVISSKTDAQELISFLEMLLKVIFEFPAAVKRKTSAKP